MKGALSLRVGLVIVSFFLLTALDSSHAGEAGIEGTISVSPSRPGPLRQGEAAEAPVANTDFVVKKGDDKITAFKTDGSGHFHINLPSGRYVLTREGPGTGIGRWHFEVTVEEGKMASVHWTADSGMR